MVALKKLYCKKNNIPLDKDHSISEAKCEVECQMMGMKRNNATSYNIGIINVCYGLTLEGWQGNLFLFLPHQPQVKEFSHLLVIQLLKEGQILTLKT